MADTLAPISMQGALPQYFSRFCDTVGDGTGNKTANGDYSGTGLGETIFKVVPAAGEVMRIGRMLVTIEDTAGMSAEEYGNLGAALSTGIKFRCTRDGVEIQDLTDGIPIKTNAEYGRLGNNLDVKTWSSGNELFAFKWTFLSSGGVLRLSRASNEAFEVVLNDNLTGLIDHHFVVQGVYEHAPA